MFRKLRWQFIGIALGTIATLLALFAGVVVTINTVQNENEIHEIMKVLTQTQGRIPEENQLDRVLDQTPISSTRLLMSEYVTVQVNESGEVLSSDTERIADPSRWPIETLAKQVSLDRKDGRFSWNGRYFAYQVFQDKEGHQRVILLDISLYRQDQDRFIGLSMSIYFFSLLVVGVVVYIFSGRAIRPFVENIHNQKRFITNAGHELKTPLAIISANTEMQEMIDGENEWSKSTKDQVDRLTKLINQMVAMAKLEEQTELVLSTCDLSVITEDAAEDFKGLMRKHGKTFKINLTDGLLVKAEEKSLFELVTILVDNAVKYCDEGGTVRVRTRRNRLRRPVLEVSNSYAAGKNTDYSRFFDRFYREDASHNSKVGGFGIGLSTAQSMTRIFKARLSAHYKGSTITFRVTF